MSDILFFPNSMPDETLHSRITRYHLLSGNMTETESFRDLFGAVPFCLSMLPKQVEVLAARLPGNAESNLEELINSNTIFPAYRPFLGMDARVKVSSSNPGFSGALHVPRRDMSVTGKARICPSCVKEDLIEQGYPYWHRSHHLPAVSVCWRHGDPLIHVCPNCALPFYRKRRLLPSLTETCACGWSPLQVGSERKGAELEKDLAAFAHDILQRKMPLFSCDVVSSCYVRQARQLGFVYGERVNTRDLVSGLSAHYSDELLTKVDPAYEVRNNQWLRLQPSRGRMDMPLARHFIVALYLFGSAESFDVALRYELNLHAAPKPLSVRDFKEPSRGKKSQYRQKIRAILTLRKKVNLEYLWTAAYRPTKWMVENDSDWLMEQLRAKNNEKLVAQGTNDPRDEEFAAIIQEGAQELYQLTKDQKRVNKNNLLQLLPFRLPRDPSMFSLRFPLVAQQVELSRESIWHFHLRRVVWSLSELSRTGLSLTIGNLKLVCTVPENRLKVFAGFFEWDLEALGRNGVNPEALLKSTGVSTSWVGPVGFAGLWDIWHDRGIRAIQ